MSERMQISEILEKLNPEQRAPVEDTGGGSSLRGRGGIPRPRAE
ncbi:MAG: hypothetical protein ACLUHK_03405 [Eubacteriales bacterium]